MATDIKFSIYEAPNCKTITFIETTGEYNVSSNPNGWGTPNEETSDATAATLTLVGPDGTTYPSIDLEALSSFPKDDSTEVVINSTDLLSTMTSFVDGQWKITYSVTTSTTTYTKTVMFFFTCQIEKVIDKLLAKLDINDCECKPGQIEEILKLTAYADAMKYAIGGGNLTEANEILKTLNRLSQCC